MRVIWVLNTINSCWKNVKEKIIIENSNIISLSKNIFDLAKWKKFQRIRCKSKSAFIFYTTRWLRKAVQQPNYELSLMPPKNLLGENHKNDLLHVGPTIQKNLLYLLLRWRCHRFVITADIKKCIGR